MSKTREIGRRIELMSMDRHCGGISIGLYRRDSGGISQVLVHSYGQSQATKGRVAFVTRALSVVAGLQSILDSGGWLRFPCDSFHERALKRAFLDVCRLGSLDAVEPKPLSVFDKKSGCNLTILALGNGVYQVDSEQQTEAAQKRAKALAGGFVKLCEMDAVAGELCRVSFPCGTNHDELIGALTFRVQNVRMAMREDEQSATRGILAAPSQQE